MTNGTISMSIIKFSTIVWTLIAIAFTQSIGIHANDIDEIRYRRSSICSILIKHNEQKFADEIERQFSLIPISYRFNDHNLSIRVIDAGNKKIDNNTLDAFIDNNLIASRLVARWFDRNILTGECVLDTIKARGLYDATSFDREIADRSVRGLSILEDAGEDLIEKTFLLLNEVNYVDKSKRSAVWATVGSIAMGALMAAGGANSSEISNTMQNTATIINSYKGFSVKIRTRLYQLVWDADISNEFYSECYSEISDENKKMAFETLRPQFKLKYVGEVESKGGRTSFLGINEEEPEIMVRKACARAIDENIVDLQHKFESFRIKAPIVAVLPEIKAYIGKKEGISKDSKFEVLEIQEKNGRTEYHRVGIVKPVADKIWDNRFMAKEEGVLEADIGATTFVKVSGGEFYPGLLLREIE